MKIEATPNLTPDQVKALTQTYFTEGLARLKTHVSNVDSAFNFTQLLAEGDNSELEHVTNLIHAPVFYLPDSMKGIKARDSSGKATEIAFKIAGVPMEMKPVSIEDIMAYVVKQNNLTLSSQSPAYKRLTQGINQAVDELKNIHAQYGEFILEPEIHNPTFKDTSSSAKVVEMPSSRPFSELTEAYAKDVQGAFEKETFDRKRIAYRWFSEKFGDLPIQTINKQTHANGFKALLTRIPSFTGQRHKGKTAPELEKVEGPKISRKSQITYLQAMSSFFAWAIANGYYTGENPFSGIQPPKPDKKSLVDDEEEGNSYSPKTLTSFFASPLYTGHRLQRTKTGPNLIKDSMFWVPLIALFTGARMQEICQLYTSDIREENGVWIMDINRTGPDKYLKTDTSKRLVPIHKQLIELGFIAYIQSQQSTRVFPDIHMSPARERYSSVFSKRYANVIKTLKLKEGKTNFHSFRHTFIDAMRKAEANDFQLMALVGHKDARQTAKYGSGYPIGVMKQAMDKVSYPFIDWQNVGVIKP